MIVQLEFAKYLLVAAEIVRDIELASQPMESAKPAVSKPAPKSTNRFSAPFELPISTNKPPVNRASALLHEEGLKWLKKAANQVPNVLSSSHSSSNHHNTLSHSNSMATFFQKSPAHLQAHAEAQFLLAEIYVKGSAMTMGEGVGLDVDFEKALSLYVQAAKQGHVTAAMKAGWCYEYGNGTKKDATKAGE